MRVILIPHPASEPTLAGPGFVPWNTGRHCRKFLSNAGRYVAGPGGASDHGELFFWGEYEGPTMARTVLQRCAGGARYVHVPTAELDRITRQPGSSCTSGGCCQNTDPWLWHDGFTWTVCRHTGRGNALRPLIRNWSEPAIVLFGSALDGNWVLDTVLVAGAQQRRPAALKHLKKTHIADRAYRTFVLDPLPGNRLLRPICGTAYEPEDDAMFSFVPATTDPKRAFARPPIGQLFRYLRMGDGTSPSVRNSRSLTECRITGGERGFWSALVETVTDQGLVLAVKFDAPAAWNAIT